MGLRTILFGLALWGVYLIIRHLVREKRKNQAEPTASKSVDSVQCAHCGLHLPRDEALKRNEHYYCSQAHLDAADSDNPSD